MLGGSRVLLARCAVIALLIGGSIVSNLRANDNGDRLQSAMDEYSRLDAAAQQQWLSDLFRFRSEPACRQTMKPKEVERQLIRQRSIIDRVGDGRLLTTAGLHQLLTEVDSQETLAIAKLEEAFRLTIQQTLADDPAEIERRATAWEGIWSAWEGLGRPWEEQPKLIYWLERAIAHQKAFSHAPLPAAPTFQSKTPPAQEVPSVVTATNQPSKVPAEEPIKRLIKEPTIPPIDLPADPQSPVDVEELRVRIEGYNLALVDLLANLQGQEPWWPNQLEALIEAMDDLDAVRADLMLYWNVLPAATRSTLKSIEPLDPVIALAASKTAAARKRFEQPAASRRSDDQVLQLRRLDRVSRRLAELAQEKTRSDAD